MADISENLSRLEEQAQELVAKLRVLNEQIGSYKEAKETLRETGQHLELLIDTNKNLAEESKAIIAKFNEINGAGFIERVESVKDGLDQFKAEMADQLETLRKKNQRRLLIVYAGIVIVIVLEVLKVFFIDKASFLQFLSPK
jgi:cold shock CspA family protein